MKALYQVELYDPTGEIRLGYLSSFISMERARKVNDVGALRMVIDAANVPAGALDRNQRIMRDLRIAIFRAPAAGAAYLLAEYTVWFVRGCKRIRTRRGAVLEIRAVDANHLLSRRIVAAAAGSAAAKKTGAADDVIKQIARENLGTGAIAARRMYGVTVDNNFSLGPTITKAFAWQNLLMTCQEICADAAQQTTPVYLYFDMVAPSANSLSLRTFLGQRGMDRTRTTPVGGDYGNLTEASTDYDTQDEITYVYCGGQGEGTARTIAEYGDTARIALSPYNRIEAFVDARNTDDATALPGEARAAVRAGRPRFSFEGGLVSVAGSVYGIDFNFGDKVRAQSDVDSFECRIDAIKITVDRGGEKIDVKLWSAD